MKFLIIRLSNLGDIIQTTPVIRCLKQQRPDAEIHYLSHPDFQPVLAANPYIDKVLVMEHSLQLLIHELKQENYSYIIDLQHNSTAASIKRALRCKSFTLKRHRLKNWIRSSLRINILPKTHMVERYLAVLKKFNIRNDGQGLDYFIPKTDEIKGSDIPVSHGFGYIAILINTAYNTRRLPLDKLKQLCAAINHPIILLGEHSDKTMGDEIAATDDIKIYNACGKFNLNETADLIKKAKVVITHDNSLMHVSAAYKKPIISVWGNTIPGFGGAPYYGDYQSKESRFEVEGLWCRPCSAKGYKKCPLNHFKCMQLHHVEKMARLAVNSIEPITM